MLRYAESGEIIDPQVIIHSAVHKMPVHEMPVHNRPVHNRSDKVSWLLKGQKTLYHENICKILQSRLSVH